MMIECMNAAFERERELSIELSMGTKEQMETREVMETGQESQVSFIDLSRQRDDVETKDQKMEQLSGT
jgi:hypothetical protein